MRTGVMVAAVCAVAMRQSGAQTAPVGSPQQVDYSRAVAALQGQIPKAMDQANIPGLAIALVDGDRLVWAQGFGFTDRTKTARVTQNTLFSLQSISKTYTATAVLLAVEKGWLTLDDPLARYIPTFQVNSRYGNEQV